MGRARAQWKPVWEEYSQQLNGPILSLHFPLSLLWLIFGKARQAAGCVSNPHFLDSHTADSETAIGCSTAQIQHVCECQYLCNCSSGLSRAHLQVSYTHTVFLQNWIWQNAPSAVTVLIVPIVKVGTKAQGFFPSKSNAERCLHFTLCCFTAQFSPIKLLYTRNDHFHHSKGVKTAA